jgi:Tfp pilus assembly protein FimT
MSFRFWENGAKRRLRIDCCQFQRTSSPPLSQRLRSEVGASLIETVIVVSMTMLMAAIAVPKAGNALKTYRLNSSVEGVTGAIKSTRYRAMMYGCPHRVVLDSTTRTYQISSQTLSGSPQTCSAGYTNFGGLVNWSATSDMSLTPSKTFQFSPNGTVTETGGGALSFTMTNGLVTKTVSISGAGNVTVQ